MKNSIRDFRMTLGLSQSKLSRLSGVRREKIHLHELGAIERKLSADEERRIHAALAAEADRLRNLPLPDLGPKEAIEVTA